MVIPDWGSGPRPPNFKLTLQESVETHQLARPLDRLGAAIIDVFVLLIPLYILLSAPLKKTMMMSFLLGSEVDFILTIVYMVALAITLIVAYQALMHFFYGATVGKKIFGLRVVPMFHGEVLGLWDFAIRG